MLLGRFDNSIDAKGRMIVPAKLRGDLGERCVLAYGLDRNIDIFLMESWMEFERTLLEFPQEDESVRRYLRYFFESAEECEIDKQSRITIPQKHRDYAGLDKEIATIGFGRKVQVFDRESYDSQQKPSAEDANKWAAHIVSAYGKR